MTYAEGYKSWVVRCSRLKKRLHRTNYLMARPERFERPTPWFEAKYSIQLDWAPKKIYHANDHLTFSLLDKLIVQVCYGTKNDGLSIDHVWPMPIH